METRKGLGVMTMRHFLFYLGVAAAIGIVVGVLAQAMNWSDGLTFAVLVVTCTISFAMSVRETLFEGFQLPRRRQQHRRV